MSPFPHRLDASSDSAESSHERSTRASNAARRRRIAEFPHAWIKERYQLRQFRCRGRLKATMEATWASLSYNLSRWFAIQRSRSNENALTTA
jgi:hypothetical protein